MENVIFCAMVAIDNGLLIAIKLTALLFIKLAIFKLEMSSEK